MTIRRNRMVVIGALALLAGVPATFGSQAQANPSPLYHPPVKYAGNGGPGHGAVGHADFDGDGDVDLAVTDFSAGAVRLWSNQGDGTFAATGSYATGPGAGSVATADLDSDGDADLAVVNTFETRFATGLDVLANQGDGTFVPAGSYGTGSIPVHVVAADFNRDGLPDLASVGAEPFQNIMVLLNQGAAQFVRSDVQTVGLIPLSMETADVNGDGSSDLLVGDSVLGVMVFTSNGNGTFMPGVRLLAPGLEGIAVGDANGDGAVDVAVPGLIRNSVSVFLGYGNGTFRAPIESRVNPEGLFWPFPNTIAVAAAMADLNGDGHNDLAVSGGADSQLYIMVGNGSGGFTTVGSHPVQVPRTIVADDLNNDGGLDLVATESFGQTAVLLHT